MAEQPTTPAQAMRDAAARIRQDTDTVRAELDRSEAWPANAAYADRWRLGVEDGLGGPAGEFAGRFTPALADLLADAFDAIASEMNDYPAVYVEGGVGLESWKSEPDPAWTAAHRVAQAYADAAGPHDDELDEPGRTPMSLGRLVEIEARYGPGRSRMDVGTKTEMLRVVHEFIDEMRRQFRDGRAAAAAPKDGYRTSGRIEGPGRVPVVSNQHNCWVLMPTATYQLLVGARGLEPIGGMDDPNASSMPPGTDTPHPDDAAVTKLRTWLDGAHDEDLIELDAQTLRRVLAVLDGWHENAENMREQRNTAQTKAEQAAIEVTLARQDAAAATTHAERAEAALAELRQQLGEPEDPEDVFEPGHTYRSENGYFEFRCDRRIGDIALGIETVLKGWNIPAGAQLRRWTGIGPSAGYHAITPGASSEGTGDG